MEAKVKERPILFNDEMVRAILDGRKTQTRRPIKQSQFRRSDTKGYDFTFRDSLMLWYDVSLSEMLNPPHKGFPIRSPFGQPGDELWVRECFCHKADQHGVVTGANGYWYRASDPGVTKVDEDGCIAVRRDGTDSSPWTPSIHMPREASRIQLIVKRVWVERVTNISKADAAAEGYKRISKDGGITWKFGIPDKDGLPGSDNLGMPWSEWNTDPRKVFQSRWDLIYAAKGYGWDDDAWVWCCEFEVKNKEPQGE